MDVVGRSKSKHMGGTLHFLQYQDGMPDCGLRLGGRGCLRYGGFRTSFSSAL